MSSTISNTIFSNNTISNWEVTYIPSLPFNPTYYVVKFGPPSINEEFKSLWCIPTQISYNTVHICYIDGEKLNWIRVGLVDFHEQHLEKITFEKFESLIAMGVLEVIPHYFSNSGLVFIIRTRS